MNTNTKYESLFTSRSRPLDPNLQCSVKGLHLRNAQLKYESTTYSEQNWESTEGYLRWKVQKRPSELRKAGLNNKSISKFQKGTEAGVRRVSVPCWHATFVENAPWKSLVIRWRSSLYQGHEIGEKSDPLGIHFNWSRVRMSFTICDRETPYWKDWEIQKLCPRLELKKSR